MGAYFMESCPCHRLFQLTDANNGKISLRNLYLRYPNSEDFFLIVISLFILVVLRETTLTILSGKAVSKKSQIVRVVSLYTNIRENTIKMRSSGSTYLKHLKFSNGKKEKFFNSIFSIHPGSPKFLTSNSDLYRSVSGFEKSKIFYLITRNRISNFKL